jgi:hypothetical protein
LIEHDSRLRVGRAIGKTEEEVAEKLMVVQKRRGNPDKPPSLTSDAAKGYQSALINVYGIVPDYAGRGRPPTKKQACSDWEYLQIVKHRRGGHLVKVTSKVIYGDAQTLYSKLGKHTSYVERTHLTSRQMNGRLVRKTLSYSKRVDMLEFSCLWEDMVYNLVRPLKTLRLEVNEYPRRWLPRTPAMVAGLTDHIWTIDELLTTRVSSLLI